MIVARKIAYNVVFNATTKILSTILALVGIGFITRYLGKEGFGNYATVLAFFAFFGSIADLGIYAIATREISRENAPESEIMGKVFSLRVLISLTVFILSPIIYFLPYSPEIKWGIMIAAGAFVFSSSYSILNGIFQKYLAMDRVGITELFGKIIQTGVIIWVVKQDLGFTAINLSLLLFMIFNFLIIFWLSRKYIPYKFTVDFEYWKNFLKESWPMGISVIITFIYFKLDTILLSLLRSSADVGTYNAAYKVIENITFFPAMIIGLIFPIMSRFIFSERAKFEDITNKLFKVFVVFIAPIVIGTFFLAPEIIRLIGGTGFEESATVLRVLIFALAFIFFSNISNNILIAGNQQKNLMKALIICATLNIISNLILIPRYGYMGAAYTSVFTEMLVVILTSVLVIKKFKYIPKVEYAGKIALSALVMIAFLIVAGDIQLTNSFVINFLLLGVGSVTAYALLLWITRAVKAEEILSIFKKSVAEVKQ